LLTAAWAGAWLGAPAAFASDPSIDRVAPLAHQAWQQAGSAQALVPLAKLYALKGKLEELEPLEDAFLTVASTRRANPDVAALARFYAADIERARGFPNRAANTLSRLGLLSHFQVIGGFDNEGKAGFAKAYPPEQSTDFAKAYPGKAREVRWRPLEVADPSGYVDLSSAVRPVHQVVAYAAVDLLVSKDTRAVLHLGASGATALFVDGQRVLQDPQYHPAKIDQHAVAVTLRKGTHRVLLKLAQDDGAMGFFLRASGPRGEPLPTVTEALPSGALEPVRGSLQAQVIPPLVDALDRAAKQSPKSAAAHAALARALAFTATYDVTDRRPAQASARAAQLAPGDADIQMLAAHLEDADANVRRGYLEAAARAAPDAAAPQLALAADDLSRGHPARALQRLQRQSVRIDSPALQLLWARAQDDLGDFAAAERRVQAVRRAHPRDVAAVRDAARQARQLGRNAQQVSALRVALSLRYDDVGSRKQLVSALVSMGRLDDALEAQAKVLALRPTDLSAWSQRGALLAANGKGALARDAFTKAIALCPDDADLREAQGNALLSLGDRPGAEKAFAASLALRPQNPRLEAALRTLHGEERGFGESYAVSARELAKATPVMKDEDAEVLSLLTAVKVNPNGTSTRYVQKIARVNTDRGVDRMRATYIDYSPDRQEVSVLRARILRPDGSVVTSHDEGDRNLSEPWSGIYYDARARVVSFPNLQPGDVEELVYRVDDAARDNLLSNYFGDLQMLQGAEPKHQLTYILEAPTARAIYSNTPRIAPAQATQVAQKDGTTLYRWAWADVPKIDPEPAMPGWGEASASLHVSTYKSWDDVGRFYWGLVHDQLFATDDVKRTAHALAQGIAPGDDLAKVRAVYDFVVSKTRYVGLEFGIHGYKPYPVDRILSRHFGDCKDKASLMHALLGVLGVPSDLVLVRMRHLGDVAPNPASLAIFNHAILYVPKLDLYLDGTAEYFGSSELPGEDRGAMVLVVKPDGGSEIGHIPLGQAAQNRTDSSYEVALGRDGSAHIAATSTVVGLSAPQYRRAYATAATRRAVFERAWSQTFPGLTVERVDLGDTTQLEQPVKLSFALQVPHYAEATATGFVFSPFFKVRSYVETYAPLSARHFDVVLPFPWENHFVYRYELPAGAKLGALPTDVDTKSKFGEIHLAYRMDGGALICEGRLSLTESRVKVADYPAFRAFLGELDAAIGRRIDVTPSIRAPALETQARARE